LYLAGLLWQLRKTRREVAVLSFVPEGRVGPLD
jgi:transcription initiation factor TFIIIB Brf1 subunit/transcription initiation factor TFIIB